MGNLKEMYQMVLDSYKNYSVLMGICTHAYFLKVANKISENNYEILLDDLKIHMPQNDNLYKWPLADRQSRIEFLESRIKELSK